MMCKDKDYPRGLLEGRTAVVDRSDVIVVTRLRT
jgi:hypothetical protein